MEGRHRLLALALLSTLALAATASAKTVSYHNIVSPTKQISCLAVKGSTEIECSAPYLPDIGDLDTYVALRKHGRSRLSERGDFPGFSDRRRTLHYGDTWKRPGISCTMRRTGLTCRNADDHGFHIQSPVLRF
jgi:hypothetical protein